MNFRLGLSAIMVTAAFHTIGCCGVAAAPDANVVNGVVTFDPVVLGASEQLPIPFMETKSDTSETILSATISGPDADAFQVMTTFPLAVPANEDVSVQILFTPTHAGNASATLVLNTQAMGPSPVQLAGTGESP
jgi:hypothetical protein